MKVSSSFADFAYWRSLVSYLWGNWRLWLCVDLQNSASVFWRKVLLSACSCSIFWSCFYHHFKGLKFPNRLWESWTFPIYEIGLFCKRYPFCFSNRYHNFFSRNPKQRTSRFFEKGQQYFNFFEFWDVLLPLQSSQLFHKCLFHLK